MPHNGSLCPLDTKNFIRKLQYKIGSNFKYFLCGEYGDKNDRPHYHALIFGYDFGLSEASNARSPFDTSKNIPKSKTSFLSPLHNTTALSCPELDSLWQMGHTSIGELTFDSAAYVAQYSMKKVNGSKAAEHYSYTNPETGEVTQRLPEFMRQSQNAIGKQYAQKYSREIILHNSVLANGQPQPIPNYYLKQYTKLNLDLDTLKQKREEFSQTHSVEKSYIRAQQLDSKFNLKISKADAFRVRYAKDLYFRDLKPKDSK